MPRSFTSGCRRGRTRGRYAGMLPPACPQNHPTTRASTSRWSAQPCNSEPRRIGPGPPVGPKRSVVASWHQRWVPQRATAACATRLSAMSVGPTEQVPALQMKRTNVEIAAFLAHCFRRVRRCFRPARAGGPAIRWSDYRHAHARKCVLLGAWAGRKAGAI